ncbi:DHA2 family efflux MFS transporter permease subunit [Pseudonocardia humida]|uniref:DHA2 family efflux MFS transporter permease subunit n=1 Tax=Pseudonocardia humida TaxID=2800819 RepID=A0ABT1ADH1_9PSEU|nr:DHA2 family efflux MFS transporter permease subunit [Pseudonocardia humida]MCO1660634.1 DHA2 family efflux MFS transporter permease subunit [Pseudonocardia humida]
MTTTTHPQPGEATAPPTALSPRDRTVIGVLLVSAFVAILNETTMTVALPVLLRELQIEASVGQWLTAGFLLTMSVVIPITGFLIRRVGTRVLYGTAMALFSVGTLVAALAPGFGVLLVARIIQAGGTAIMMPLLMTTVMTLVPPQRRGALMGNISIVISVAPAIGPTVSGLVLQTFGWRAIFWLVLVVAVVALVLGLRKMSDIGERTDTPVDLPSVVLSVLGFGGLVYGLSSIGHSSDGGQTPVAVWVAFGVGVVGLALFVARQIRLQRTDRALLDLRTFRSRTFTTASVLMMVMMATLIGTIVLLPIYMQGVLGLDPLTTGLLLLPGGLLMGLMGPVVGRLYDRFGPRTLLVPGTVLTSLSLWSTTLFSADSASWQVVAFHVTLSAGLALVFTPLFTAGLGSVEPRFYSYGSAIFGTTQQLAGAAGVAALVSVMSVRAAGLAAEGAPLAEQTAGGVHAAFLVAAVLSLTTIVGAFLIRVPEVEGPETFASPEPGEPAAPATGAAAAVPATAVEARDGAGSAS